MLGVAEQRVVVEVDLRVERHHAAVAGDDQRVDLGERGVGVPEALVQALQQRRAPAPSAASGMPILRATSARLGVGRGRPPGRRTPCGSSPASSPRLPRCPCRPRRRPSAPRAACRGPPPCRRRAPSRCRRPPRSAGAAPSGPRGRSGASRAACRGSAWRASRTSSSDFATLTPPPLPRPPAWICAFTTQTLPPSCFAASTASSTLKQAKPRGVATPYLRKISLPWYSWIFMRPPSPSLRTIPDTTSAPSSPLVSMRVAMVELERLPARRRAPRASRRRKSGSPRSAARRASR